MRYVWATGSHQGRVRQRNEDSVFPESSGSGEGPALVAVADGMGGHVAGDRASRIAIDAASVKPEDGDVLPVDRVRSGNEAILDEVRRTPSLSGMGTTMTLAVFDPGGSMAIGHVGDSRAYLVRDGELMLLTQDHTVVGELIRLGHLDPEAEDTHPQRHLLTRSLGLGPVEVDQLSYELEDGDRVMFCSDGLTTMIDDSSIRDILIQSEGVEAAVWELIEAANTAGGIDNTTVVVVDARA